MIVKSKALTDMVVRSKYLGLGVVARLKYLRSDA
jgi:hypothetical protein